MAFEMDLGGDAQSQHSLAQIGIDAQSQHSLAQSNQQGQEPGSRFSRFFQMDPSASTSHLPNMAQDPALVPQPAAKQPSQPIPASYGGQTPPDINQLQVTSLKLDSFQVFKLWNFVLHHIIFLENRQKFCL